MKKILIVDDSAFMRNVLREIIMNNAEITSAHEIEIHEANAKKKALEIARKHNPDIILLDIVMEDSDMEGIEFITEANEFFDLGRIIMVSSISHMDILDTCKNLGVKHYIQKPFVQSEVVESVKTLID